MYTQSLASPSSSCPARRTTAAPSSPRGSRCSDYARRTARLAIMRDVAVMFFVRLSTKDHSCAEQSSRGAAGGATRPTLSRAAKRNKKKSRPSCVVWVHDP